MYKIARLAYDWGGFYAPNGELIREGHMWAETDDILYVLSQYGLHVGGAKLEIIDEPELMQGYGWDRCPKNIVYVYDAIEEREKNQFS